MDNFYRQALSYLPPNLQALVLDPPSLSRPATFMPLVRALLPYTQYLVAIVAVYVVYSVLSGLVAHVSRFLRFTLKIGPLFALASWLFAQSGQGNGGVADQLFALVKQYTGMDPAAAGRGAGGANAAAGFDALKGMFAESAAGSRAGSKSKRGGKAGTGGGLWDGAAKSASTKRKGDKADEPMDVVKDFVKAALAKAAGLEWLMNLGGSSEDDKRKSR